MKYRLKKDLPWAKAGSEWESARDICAESIGMGCLDLPGHVEFIPKSTFSDWFEPIEKRWKPKEGEDTKQVKFSKKQNQAIRDVLDDAGFAVDPSGIKFATWLDQHTIKE